MKLAYADPPYLGRAWNAWRAQCGLFLALSPAAEKRAARRAAAKADDPPLEGIA